MKERKVLIEKAIPELTPLKYGRFKFSKHYIAFNESLTAYESKGSKEKKIVSKLREAFLKLDEKLLTLEAFTSDSEF
jgi:hypothetical protein